MVPKNNKLLTVDKINNSPSYTNHKRQFSENKKKKSNNNKVRTGSLQQSSPTVVVYANSPYQETNEGKLIRKLGEKQKMIEKYEVMLSTVNNEFKNLLSKNKELSNEISMLEMRLKQADERYNEIKSKADIERYSLQRQIDELLLEKDELKNDNFSVNKLLKQKNQEIDEIKEAKLELESRHVSNTETIKRNKSESELKINIDSLTKHVSELEYEIKKKDDDYRSDTSNYELIIQSNKKEIEQMMKQRNELTDQNLKLKEQLWKENLEIRQTTNENDNLKRENLNLKSTVELIQDNEKELRNENQYLRETSLANERKILVYQNMLTKAGNLSTEYGSHSKNDKNFNIVKVNDNMSKPNLGVDLSKFSPLNFPQSNPPMHMNREPNYQVLNPLSMSHDSASYSNIRSFLTSVNEEPELRASIERHETSLSVPRMTSKGEKIDPSTMRPAGVTSIKGSNFDNKHSSHYYSEIEKLKEFSHGRGGF